MRTIHEIKNEIESRFGFFPPFFAPALNTPQILENLWQQTLSAYVDNPLPALFKEKFAAIVARSCSVPYCLVCHSCTLRPLGMRAAEVLDLLEKWHTPSESDIRESLSLLEGYKSKIGIWPESGSPLEDAILHISVQIFFGDDEAENYLKEIRRVIGDKNYAFLTLFFAYNKTCLTWAEAHATELSFEADKRAVEHLGPLLAEEPRLGEFFKNYKEKFSNAAKSKLTKQMRLMGESKYQKLVQLSPAGIFQADATGKFVFVSEGWQRVAGLSLEEAINAGWENAVHPDDKEKIFKEWISSNAEKRTFKCEYRLRKPSGEITWVNAESEQLRNASGEITGYLGALQDITNLKKSEDELRLAHSQLESRVEERTADLRSLTESIPQLVWKIAPNGDSLYMSPNWEELTGVPIGQAQWEDIIHPEDIPVSKAAWVNCLSTGTSYETEYRIKLKDGTYRWFLARGVPQLDSDGKVKRWFGTCTDIHDQKIALQSNMRLAAIVESANDAIIGKDLNGIVTSWNPAAEKVFGYRREEMIGKSILKLFPEDRILEEAPILAKLQRGIQINHFETDRLRKDGTRISVLLSMSPIYDDKGQVAGVAKTARDITFEKQAQCSLVERTKSLLDLQSRFQKVSEASDLGVWYCNLPFDKLIWSDKVKEHFWMDASREVTIEDFYESLHDDDRERVRQAIAVSIEEHTSYDIEYRTVIPGSSDHWKWIRATGWTEYDSSGKPIQFDGITLDVTQQKKTLEDLKKSQDALRDSLKQDNERLEIEVRERTQSIAKEKQLSEELSFRLNFAANASTIGIWEWNILNNSLIWNAQMYQLYGLKQINGQEPYESWFNGLHPEDRDQAVAKIQDAVTKKTKFDTEFRIVLPSGEVRKIHAQAAPLLNDKGEAVRMIGVNTDVTLERFNEAELLKAREEALSASKMKSDFLANMSHEIRTPINGVIGMTSLILDTSLNAEQRDFAESIHRSADSLLTVINDILDFSKVEAGKLEFEEIDFKLQSNIRHTIKALDFQAQKKGLTLTAEVAHDLPPYLKGDPGRLGQVLNNLVCNAIKFTSTGQVTVRLTSEGKSENAVRLRCEVQDSGVGIPEKAMGRMFQVFSQVDSSTSRRFGGTGLGLSISKNLVELMGGNIGVKSAEGKGSTFWFTAEFRIGQPPPEKESEQEVIVRPIDSHAKPKRILVAEDNIVNQKITVRMLEKMGYRADVAANGQEVLDALREIPYDLILMDCQMPEMDGFEATKLIRKSDTMPFKNILILAMTANAMKEDSERCIQAGMDGYISKPIGIKQLSTILSRWLDPASVKLVS